jgi:hypothetical protein
MEKEYGITQIDGKWQVVRGAGVEKIYTRDEAFAKVAELNIPVVQADPDGAVMIKLHYHDGEYLSGHTLYGTEAKLLEKISMAKYVDGWGYLVNEKLVKALGTEFPYQEAVDYARPMLDARQAKIDREARLRQATFDLAAKTGEPVVLDQYMDECNDPREECSQDSVTVYAMPNGSTKTTRNHTW